MPAERANLISYLDRELPKPEARAIVSKMIDVATAHREVEVLEKIWELFDFQPRPKAAENFTARALTEVNQHDVRGAGSSRSSSPFEPLPPDDAGSRLTILSRQSR